MRVETSRSGRRRMYSLSIASINRITLVTQYSTYRQMEQQYYGHTLTYASYSFTLVLDLYNREEASLKRNWFSIFVGIWPHSIWSLNKAVCIHLAGSHRPFAKAERVYYRLGKLRRKKKRFTLTNTTSEVQNEKSLNYPDGNEWYYPTTVESKGCYVSLSLLHDWVCNIVIVYMYSMIRDSLSTLASLCSMFSQPGLHAGAHSPLRKVLSNIDL